MPTINLNKKPPKKKKTNNNSERRKLRQSMYNSNMWKALTKWYRSQHPFCEMCEKKGKLTPAEATHHIESPFKDGLSEEERWDLLLDIDNLMSVCVDCHLEIHGIKDSRLDKYKKE